VLPGDSVAVNFLAEGSPSLPGIASIGGRAGAAFTASASSSSQLGIDDLNSANGSAYSSASSLNALSNGAANSNFQLTYGADNSSANSNKLIGITDSSAVAGAGGAIGNVVGDLNSLGIFHALIDSQTTGSAKSSGSMESAYGETGSTLTVGSNNIGGETAASSNWSATATSDLTSANSSSLGGSGSISGTGSQIYKGRIKAGSFGSSADSVTSSVQLNGEMRLELSQDTAEEQGTPAVAEGQLDQASSGTSLSNGGVASLMGSGSYSFNGAATRTGGDGLSTSMWESVGGINGSQGNGSSTAYSVQFSDGPIQFMENDQTLTLALPGTGNSSIGASQTVQNSDVAGVLSSVTIDSSGLISGGNEGSITVGNSGSLGALVLSASTTGAAGYGATGASILGDVSRCHTSVVQTSDGASSSTSTMAHAESGAQLVAEAFASLDGGVASAVVTSDATGAISYYEDSEHHVHFSLGDILIGCSSSNSSCTVNLSVSLAFVGGPEIFSASALVVGDGTSNNLVATGGWAAADFDVSAGGSGPVFSMSGRDFATSSPVSGTGTLILTVTETVQAGASGSASMGFASYGIVY
jgi:hypothetical protein